MAKPKEFQYKKPGANGTAVRAIHSGLERLNDAIPQLRDASNDAVEAVMEARKREQARSDAKAALRTDLLNSQRRGPNG
jgi:hypothetical protein